MKKITCSAIAAFVALPLHAQYFDPAENGGKGASANGSQTVIVNKEQENKRSGELPSFDPGSELFSFDGKLWNITNNRLFRGRFEKYLAAPESPAAADDAYRKVMDDVLAAIAPTRSGGPDLPRAVALLPVAGQSPIDARLCDSLTNAIYTVWVAKKNSAALTKADAEQQRALADLHRNLDVLTPSIRPAAAMPAGSGSGGELPKPQAGAATNYARRIVELQALRTATAAKRELTELEGKMQYQSLVIQFFLQRRFEHVVLASRIYRILFASADQTLVFEKNSALAKTLSQGTGQSPTISTLDALANEAIRDVDEGVQAFTYLAARGDLDSAGKRLSEAFAAGEYLARIRTLPRAEKQRVLTLVRDSNQLVAAMEVRDFATAKKVIENLQSTAKDFDATKALAKIGEASTAAGLLIDKARMASLQGRNDDAAQALEKAREIWPTNPELKDVRAMFEKGGLQATALKDLETLITQKNYRAILNEQTRFSAAVNGIPELETRLHDVLAKVRQLDMAVSQSDHLADAGDSFGAWELLEKAAQEVPGDSEINRRRASLAGQAADLSSSVSKAQRFEKSGELGPALTWFLRARASYAPSVLAKEGIQRLTARMLENQAPPATAAQ